MKLSIVTINYNNADGLRKTLASVATQTYRDIEHIIIDAASTDGSVDVIKEYVHNVERINELTNERSVVWSSEPDGGVYAGMNKGIRKATGDYVFILNSGDELAAPNVVERMVSVLNSLNLNSLNVTDNVPILLGNIIHVYPGEKVESGKSRKVRGKSEEVRAMDVSMLTFYTGTVPHDAAFVKRELFTQYGYFDETMKICADWKLYLNMIAFGGVQPWYVNIDVVLFDMSGISNTNNELRLAERKAYLEQVLPAAVLKDYDAYARPIGQYERLRKHHIWSLVTFIERVLYKLEKWHVLR